MGNVWTERAIELAKICPRERFEQRALIALKNALTSGANLRSAENIALACSGGSDSLALLLLIWGHFPEIKDRLCVLHLNHALRGSDSEEDTKFVEEVANALGADFVCEKVDWSQATQSPYGPKISDFGSVPCNPCGERDPLRGKEVRRASPHTAPRHSSEAPSAPYGPEPAGLGSVPCKSLRDVRGKGPTKWERGEAVSPPLRGGEAALRKLRLEFYSRAMHSKGCKILLQGHQLSDVEELLIMRLTRGAGVGGLSAPRSISPQNDGRIFVRPLLDIPKHEIESLLKKLGIPWREDSTNAERDYFRCRVRHDVLPSLSAAAPFVNIARSRMLLEETDDFLEVCAEKFLKNGKKITPDIPRALLRRVLIKVFAQKGAELRAKTLDALVSAICEQTPLKFTAGCCRRPQANLFGPEPAGLGSFSHTLRLWETPPRSGGVGHFDVAWDGNELTVSEKSTNADNNLSDPADDYEVWQTISQEVVEITPELFEKIRAGEFSPDTMAFLAGTPEISVRRWEKGDAFRPLGSPGTKTLGNLFSDKKIPKERRHKIPVCVDAEGIAWVPGLPPAERFRVSCGMKALRLRYGAKPTQSA